MNHRWTPWTMAGLGFAAAVVVEAIAFPGGAGSNDPPAAIAAWYAQHATTDLVADYISLLATPLLLAFLCAAAGRLSGPARRFAQAGATAAAVFELTATAIEMSLAGSVGSTAPASTTAAVFQITPRLFCVSLLCLALSIGTLAVADRGWLRWLGAAACVVLACAGLSAAHPHGALAVLLLPAEALLVAWVIATSVTRGRDVLPVAAAQPARAS
jgi:hypothetical protein